MKWSLCLVTCFGLLAVGGLLTLAAAPQPHQQEEQSPAEQVKSEARQAFMRGKLLSNQKIVEGLSLKNYAMVQEGANAIALLVKGQHWFVLETPGYKLHSNEMSRAAQRLHDAAQAGNIEAATLRYFDLTLTCIDCHQYLESEGL